MSAAAIIHLVRVVPYCVTVGFPELRYVAVIGNKLSSDVAVGKAVSGIGGVTNGFIDKVSILHMTQEFVQPLYQHRKDRRLYLQVATTTNTNGEKVLSGVGDAGTILGPVRIATDADEGRYDCELHVL